MKWEDFSLRKKKKLSRQLDEETVITEEQQYVT